LANDLNLSVRQVNRIMLKYFGVSFKTRLSEMRLLESALRIKTTDESLQKISIDCGFNHYTNFFVSFKKKFGISPVDYRLKDE
jgi:transcriptional regulator GlxA family with amidase domain